ncbi:MAG: Nicotinamidase [Candidatus Erwinia impunctatus]|nr:Nicotinamidase [Culicoides impunctatus]
MKPALLLIDLQNDFCPGGALAVNEGDLVIAVANRYAHDFHQHGYPIIATLDWHPADHGSFASNAGQPVGSLGTLHGLPQVWWPDHCVQKTSGAELHPGFDEHLLTTCIYKGTVPLVDSYSAFFDNGRRQSTRLDHWLKEREIDELTVMGLATDYCVKYSVLDALSLGYRVSVIIAGCRGVNLLPEDSNNALEEMRQAGAIIV